MFDFVMNLTTAAIWLAIVVLLVIRRRERRGLRYGVSLLDDGMVFWYRLGVYAGTVRMIRDVNVKEPQLSGNLLGWDCRFPVCYTNQEMCQYIRSYGPTDLDENLPHSKDLLIFNEVINQRNNGLISIYGQIFVYDNRDFKPYR
jgi:hypothetical protein